MGTISCVRRTADDDVLLLAHPQPTFATLSSPTPTLLFPLHLETALQVRNEAYNVTAGALGFGIMIFSIFAVAAIVLLRVRRYQGGGAGRRKAGPVDRLWLALRAVVALPYADGSARLPPHPVIGHLSLTLASPVGSTWVMAHGSQLDITGLLDV